MAIPHDQFFLENTEVAQPAIRLKSFLQDIPTCLKLSPVSPANRSGFVTDTGDKFFQTLAGYIDIKQTGKGLDLFDFGQIKTTL